MLVKNTFRKYNIYKIVLSLFFLSLGSVTNSLYPWYVHPKTKTGAATNGHQQNLTNRPRPREVQPKFSSAEGLIDIVWNTATQVNFSNKKQDWDLRFEGFNVYAYKTNNAVDSIDYHPNKKLLTSYDLDDFIQNIYEQDILTGGINKKYSRSIEDHQMDEYHYSLPGVGKIRLRITSDPFTGGPLIKGKPYYFAITSFYVDYNNLRNKDGKTFGATGDYVFRNDSTSCTETPPQIFSVILADDLYNPPVDEINVAKSEGPSSGVITYDVVQKEYLNGHTYRVDFFIDSASTYYNSLWRLTDESINEIKFDSCDQYLFGKSGVATELLKDGFIIRIKKLDPKLGHPRFISTGNNALYDFSKARATGAFYMGKDIEIDSEVGTFSGGNDLPAISTLKSSALKADKLRKVEIRFSEKGKAYRYLNGFLGSQIQKKASYVYAKAISDTIGKGPVGKLGMGYVEVPFTAWIVDTSTKENKQLAVGFIERSKELGGNPDGEWNPGDNIRKSAEYILVFDSPYDPTGNQLEYTGITTEGKTIWADLKGFKIPKNIETITPQQRLIAESSWFNTLYLVGLEIKKNNSISPGSKLEIPVATYPYSNRDVYRFSTRISGNLNQTEIRDLFSKVNVFPNPLFVYNATGSYFGHNSEDSFVTFSNLPPEVIIKIFTISGKVIKTLTSLDKQTGQYSPFIRWNLLNDYGKRIASGIYIAIVSSQGLGEKVLKFSVIMPQK